MGMVGYEEMGYLICSEMCFSFSDLDVFCEI